MARGQGEKLMPMIADLMAEARVARRDLSAIGVGIGPGNFTGLRIAVAAARGLALALKIPAIGINSFEAILEAEGLYGGRVLISLPAPRDQVYLQSFIDGQPSGEASIAGKDDLPHDVDLIIGPAAEIAENRGYEGQPELPARLAASIARVADRRLGQTIPRPAPLYVRAPDAAPSRIVAPPLLP